MKLALPKTAADVMSNRKILLYLALFLIMLISLRLLWYSFRTVPGHPLAEQGVLDLREWRYTGSEIVTLDGEWEFHSGRFVAPEKRPDSEISAISASGGKWIQVPAEWSSAMSKESGLGYGTYRLRLLVNNTDELYSLRVPNIQTASRLYVNGKLLMEIGHPAETISLDRGRNVPYTATFYSDSKVIDITIQVSNYFLKDNGGIVQSIKFGSSAAIANEVFFSQTMQVIVCVVLLLHGLYVGILGLLGHRGKELVLYAAAILIAIMSTLIEDDKLLLIWFPIDFEWSVKLRITTYMAMALLLALCTKQLPGFQKSGKMSSVLTIFGLLSILTTITLPLDYVALMRKLLLVMMICIVILLPRMVLTAIKKGENGAFYILLSVVALSVNILIGGVVKTKFWLDMPYYPFDLIIAFLGFACYWFVRFSDASVQAKKLADRLQRADKMKDDFLVSTSHELRNPLHGMLNMAQSVLEEEGGRLGEKQRSNLQLMIRLGQRMSLSLNDLLDAALLKEQNIRLNKLSVHLPAVASGVVDLLFYISEGKQVQIVNRIPDNFPAVLVDENRLVQIMFNLLYSFIKQTNEGMIEIYAEIKNEMAHIYVSNSGYGLNGEDMRVLLELNEQYSDIGTSENDGGFRLGLSICKQLIELHGGTLLVQSLPQQGAVFTFTLPLANDTMGEQPETIVSEVIPNAAAGIDQEFTPDEKAWVLPELTAGFHKPHILVVDDDPVNLKVLHNMLASEQYEITSVTSGKEALGLLEKGEWDLVVADVMMPQMSGYELAGRIRDHYSISELPILLLTARSRPEDVYAGFASGANEYVTKPIGALELKSRVHSLINLKQSISERLRMEAAWLQAQIKPHFLFNTLNSIASLSDSDPSRMIALLEEFGNYLRVSFDPQNMERVVPLEHELELLRSYIYIEQERFGDRLEVLWEIPLNLSAELPPLTLQTIVENAVRHGVLSRSSGGTVTIRITEKADCFDLCVEDNGVGMSREKLSRLLENNTGQQKGVGLINTNRRLKQMYGHGLDIRSAPGQGTTVAFSIPKLTKANGEKYSSVLVGDYRK
ncbi:ATP-binding protein [Paenibacillus puldeungensis]|uniref:histidine kinase n=1 Tax=Paenibacillus puldeungensis TaxID=696536 RepID=A0ABW3RZS6_9BACL